MTSNASLHKRRMDAVPRGVGNAYAIYAERASNAEIIDVEGKRLIDFAGGIAVLNTGHCHPKVVAAVTEQLGKFTHTCFQVNPYEQYIRLAERLNDITPGDFAEEDHLPHHRRGSGRERGEDRARSHQARGGDRLLRRVPRPHADGHGADRQVPAVQGRLRSVPDRHLSRAVPRDEREGRLAEVAEGAGDLVQGRRRPGQRRRHHHRAGAGRGRLQHRSVRADARACARSATSTASC